MRVLSGDDDNATSCTESLLLRIRCTDVILGQGIASHARQSLLTLQEVLRCLEGLRLVAVRVLGLYEMNQQKVKRSTTATMDLKSLSLPFGCSGSRRLTQKGSDI